MKQHDLDSENVETLSEFEQLSQASCTDNWLTIADTEKSLQHIVEEAFTELFESITIFSELEIVSTLSNVEISWDSSALKLNQAILVFFFNAVLMSFVNPSEESSSLFSKKIKKSKKDTKTWLCENKRFIDFTIVCCEIRPLKERKGC